MNLPAQHHENSLQMQIKSRSKSLSADQVHTKINLTAQQDETSREPTANADQVQIKLI